MKTRRDIITIDEFKCDGCGLCVTGCPEGALQVIDGKARLVSDLLCDGLGACIGECPRGAIKIEKREAGAYDERAVMANMLKQGSSVVRAHLQHLSDHGQKNFLKAALEFLAEKGVKNPLEEEEMEKKKAGGAQGPCGCPGARMLDLRQEAGGCQEGGGGASQLRQWPVQLHLVSPAAPYFQKADLLVAADCAAYAYGGFHNDFMKGKAVVIACPKLDEGQDVYVEKIQALMEDAEVNTVTVVTMEVPCCGGLLAMVKKAAALSKRKVPVKSVIIGLQGAVKSERWE